MVATYLLWRTHWNLSNGCPALIISATRDSRGKHSRLQFDVKTN